MNLPNRRKPLSRKTFALLLIALACLQLVLMLAFGNAKAGFFIDEYYSYAIANDENGHYLPTVDNAWNDPQQFVEFLAVSPNRSDDAFNYARIYNNLRSDMAPPLYYDLLHTLCSLVPGRFTKWIGLLLNVPFLLGCLGLMGLIAWNITRSRAAVLLSCAAYALNPGTMTNAVLIRMYAMVSFFILLAVWLHLLAYDGRLRFSAFLAACAACCFLGFLVQYYFLIFMGFWALFTFVYLLAKRQAKQAWLYAATLLATLGATYLVFPFWLESMLRGTGTQGVARSLPAQLGWYGNATSTVLFAGCLWLVLAAAVGAAVWGILRARKSGAGVRSVFALSPATGKVLAVGVSSLLAFCVIAKISDITERLFTVRYLLPLFAPLLLAVTLTLYGFLRRAQLRRSLAALAVGILLTGVNVLGLTNGNSVEFLFPWDAPLLATAQQNHDKPVLVLWDNTLYIGMTAHLLQYRQVYFIPYYNHADITDDNIRYAPEVLVYMQDSCDLEAYSQYIYDQIPTVANRELMPSPVYHYKLYRFTA